MYGANPAQCLPSDSIVEAGHTSIGPFTVVLSGLDFNTTYYIRAFATNSVGTGYGNVLTLNTVNDTNLVRFIYNGQEVVYGIIISSTTGRKWLDRNLGAKRVATAYNDYEAYGDLFQWGRLADGHQTVNWESSTLGNEVNGMTNTLANSDVPGHSDFINASSSAASDWRDDNNTNRWNVTPQGPCPSGWHVPSFNEWAAETSNTQFGGTATSGGMTNRNDAFNLLKLPSVGYREGYGVDAGKFKRIGERGYYWCSTTEPNGPANWNSGVLNFGSTYAQMVSNPMSQGFCVRCIKD